MEKIKAYCVSVEKKSAEEVDIVPSLATYYELLACDCIDIVTRTVGGRTFDIICDDEALLKEPHHVSAVNHDMEPMLVGSLLFVHHDGEGNTTGITSDEAAFLGEYVRSLRTRNDPQGHPVVLGVEYE